MFLLVVWHQAMAQYVACEPNKSSNKKLRLCYCVYPSSLILRFFSFSLEYPKKNMLCSGQALVNILTSLERGIATIDASVAGLGGCPYAQGATGNVATEDVVYMLDGMGVETGIDLDRLVEAGEFISRTVLGRPSNSKAGTAIANRNRRKKDADEDDCR